MKWAYDKDGKRTFRCGEPVIRVGPTPCQECPKIPIDAPSKTREHAIELSEKNYEAWQHYLECRAVGTFPDDPIVRRNAKVLRDVYDEYEKLPMWRLFHLISLKGLADATGG